MRCTQEWLRKMIALAIALSSLQGLPNVPNHRFSFPQLNTYTAAMIIPTGIGASIGGYAGDGLPSAKLLASVVDTLITHPNVINGASLYWPIPNILYVEGFALDEFASGRIGLRPMTTKGHRIGLLLDKSIEPDLRIRHLQVANAARATLGIDVADCVVTSRPVNVESMGLSDGGASWGSIGDPDTLLDAAIVLQDRGCTAIAVVVRFPEDDEGDIDTVQAQMTGFASYRQGDGVDRIAGAEAIISHLITQRLVIPCAHAPAFAAYPAEPGVSPKACAEEIGYTYLPCVLAYLHRAPSLVPISSTAGTGNGIEQVQAPYITVDNVDALVVPRDALGGSATLSLLAKGKLVIVVEDNQTCMRTSASDLRVGLTDGLAHGSFVNKLLPGSRVVSARSYAEAAGFLAADRAGIMLESISPIVTSIPVTEL